MVVAQVFTALIFALSPSILSVPAAHALTGSVIPEVVEPETYGVVDFSRVSGDSRALGVAMMFNEYFSGINSGNYFQALGVLDPAGVVNPNDQRQVERFVKGVSTSLNSDIVLYSLATDTTGAGALRAGVRFVSSQAPGYGPQGSENETCTRWNLTYTLTERTSGEYRILRAAGSHSSC